MNDHDSDQRFSEARVFLEVLVSTGFVLLSTRMINVELNTLPLFVSVFILFAGLELLVGKQIQQFFLGNTNRSVSSKLLTIAAVIAALSVGVVAYYSRRIT